MAYCRNCGVQLVEGAKFCQKCGVPTNNTGRVGTQRQQEFAGKLYKCPNCGEVLKSFEINCPSCGHELRGVKASSAVKEFALKLEAIESRREYEKPHGLFSESAALQRVSKTDEQKISLIKSFSVPNTKEDMLEFMILATSSINTATYDSLNTNVSKSDKELNAAWLAKAQQVYEKAKRSFSSDDIFAEIKELYDKCNKDVQKAKKRNIVKIGLRFGMPFVFLALIFALCMVSVHVSENNEVARLEKIVEEIESQLERGEYKYALMNADALIYSAGTSNEELERQWAIEREYWIDKVIEEAAENGIILERPVDEQESEMKEEEDTVNSGDGFFGSIQSGMDSAKENIDEFNRIINGEESTIQEDAQEE